MLDVDHLDLDRRDIMVFIYQSGRRLVESGQKVRSKEQNFIRTLRDTFVL